MAKNTGNNMVNGEENQSDIQERRFISMMSDYGFKVTFANETDTTFLKRAIQALIKSPTRIKEVTFNKNELTAITKTSRGGLYDVTCIDERGRRFIIEMQVENLKHFIHRAKFYAFYHFNIIVKKGKYQFKDLKKIYMISILAGVAYPDFKEYHHEVALRNQHGDLIDDQITHILIELGKWDKSIEEIEKSGSDIDKLLYLMKMTQELTLEENKAKDFEYPSFFAEEWLKKALEELDLGKMSPDKRAVVEMQLLQDVQITLHREEEKLNYAKEYAKQIEQEKIKAEQEKVKAEQELIKEKREGHKLLITTLLKLNQTKEEIAQLQSWKVQYVEELIKELDKNKE